MGNVSTSAGLDMTAVLLLAL